MKERKNINKIINRVGKKEHKKIINILGKKEHKKIINSLRKKERPNLHHGPETHPKFVFPLRSRGRSWTKR